MTTYVTYSCTTCRRTKSFAKDNYRATPDHCTITKGCAGRLVPLSEQLEAQRASPLAGVDDWYARGTSRTVVLEDAVEADFELSTSASGGLIIAVKSDDESELPTQLFLTIEQRKVEDVGFQRFSFSVNSTHNAVSGETTISGRDSLGVNLRFDQATINEDRVLVRVNGVLVINGTLTPNTITFETALTLGTAVEVIVYSEKITTEHDIVFTRNSTLIPSLVRGSWSNIDYVNRVDMDGNETNWYLYSTDSVSGLASGKIRVVENDITADAMFLLASSPYQSVDRYLNFFVEQADLENDFLMTCSSGKLLTTPSVRTEIYPALWIAEAAYLADDLYTVNTSSALVADTVATRFTSSKIFGPI